MLPRKRCTVPVLALSLLLVIHLVSSQFDENNCTDVSLVFRFPNGSLGFDSLPDREAPDTEEYNPQGLTGWYDLARGFVNVVQPENLPYDVIEDTILTNNLSCNVRSIRRDINCLGGEVNPQDSIQEFGEWWAPLIAVTVLGGVMAILFGVVGAIFWCCRCAGQCGGGRSKIEPQDTHMFITTILLLLVVLLLFVGVVLSFYSNEQAYDTIESLQDTINDIIDVAVGYIEDFIDDGNTLFCQFIQVTNIALNETEVLNNSLNVLIDDVGVDVRTALQQLSGLSTGITMTAAILMNVTNTTSELQFRSDTLSMTLSNIAINVAVLATNCTGVVPQCSQIPDPAIFEAGADYNNLPNVTQELTDVQNSLDGINLTRSIDQGNAEFERITRDIQTQINSNLGGLDGSSESSSVLTSITDTSDTLFEVRDHLVGNLTKVIRNNFSIDDCPSLGELFRGGGDDSDVNVGYIRQCYFNQMFEWVQQYDVYRYAFGIIICSLALVTVVLALLGLSLGVLGWRKDRSTDSRTQYSHCGGIILLINVGLLFLFAFGLLIFASLTFFFGSNMQKVCQAVEPPEYELFVRVVDNRELWQSSLLGEVLLGRGDILSLSDALRSCEDDRALYSAFNLSRLFDVRMEIVNTSQVFDELEQEVDETINSFNYTSDSFLDNDTRNALNNFTSANVDAINITAFNEILSEDVLGFDLDSTITDLEALSQALTNADENSLAAYTDEIIADLEDIRDNQIPAIQSSADRLSSEVDQLSNHIDNVVSDTNEVVDDINGLVGELTVEVRDRVRTIANTSLQNLERYIDDFIDHIATSIEQNVSRCKPLVTIYESAYSLVCNEMVDGLNGYWWSLGFCVLWFIPLIILSVCASTHYLRQKKLYDDDGGYNAYPMKTKM